MFLVGHMDFSTSGLMVVQRMYIMMYSYHMSGVIPPNNSAYIDVTKA